MDGMLLCRDSETDVTGGVSVNGAKGLKGTQAYTEAFAHELLKAYLGTNLDSHNHLEEQSPDSDDDTPEVPSNVWEDARLCDVVAFMSA